MAKQTGFDHIPFFFVFKYFMKAHLDIRACGFWDSENGRNNAFFDVRVFHPSAPSYQKRSLPSLYRQHEKKKRLACGKRVLEVERPGKLHASGLYEWRRDESGDKNRNETARSPFEWKARRAISLNHHGVAVVQYRLLPAQISLGLPEGPTARISIRCPVNWLWQHRWSDSGWSH